MNLTVKFVKRNRTHQVHQKSRARQLSNTQFGHLNINYCFVEKTQSKLVLSYLLYNSTVPDVLTHDKRIGIKSVLNSFLSISSEIVPN